MPTAWWHATCNAQPTTVAIGGQDQCDLRMGCLQGSRARRADGGRRGLGIEISVRQYQWASVLAEDIFIGTFDVKNVSRNNIPEAIASFLTFS